MKIQVEEYVNESRREVSWIEVWKFEDVPVRSCRRTEGSPLFTYRYLI